MIPTPVDSLTAALTATVFLIWDYQVFASAVSPAV
jgi:hypothetical protein